MTEYQFLTLLVAIQVTWVDGLWSAALIVVCVILGFQTWREFRNKERFEGI